MKTIFVQNDIIFQHFLIFTYINRKKFKRIYMKEYQFLESRKEFPLAMAYVPWQHMENVYENLEEAFMIGTIFPELNKPFTGRRPKS